jgi:hypothetical protein
MKRPLQEKDEQDGAVAIGLRKGMNQTLGTSPGWP